MVYLMILSIRLIHDIIKDINLLNDLDNRSSMPAIATAPNLSHYPKLKIASYRSHLRNGKADSLRMNYRYRSKPYSYSIKLSKTPCNYGNYRYWFSCPSCSKRVAVLYCVGIYVCRHCIGANYGSQLEQPIDNLFRRLNTLRARLGWQVGIASGYEQRPKGMHRTTYDKLICEYDNLMERLIGAHRKILDKINEKII